MVEGRNNVLENDGNHLPTGQKRINSARTVWRPFVEPTESVLHVEGGQWLFMFSQIEVARELYLSHMSMRADCLKLIPQLP